jgi:hypothetical protein
MNKSLLTALAAVLSLFSAAAAWAQAANPCDLNQDGVVDKTDVNLAISMVLGLTPCTANVIGAGVCNIVVVQRVTNAVLNQTCLVPPPHSVSLNWTASTSSNVIGYNVYRGIVAGGPYFQLNSSALVVTSFTDTAVQPGQTYFYVTTAIDNNGNESAYSNQAQAVIPTP